MKDSRDRWITNRYPLIEVGMSPEATALTGGPPATTGRWNARPCVACPFQSRRRWVETKGRWPEMFAEAVEIDARLRDGLAFAKEPYLHSLRLPLPRRSHSTRRTWEWTGRGTGSGTNARDIVECRDNSLPSYALTRYTFRYGNR